MILRDESPMPSALVKGLQAVMTKTRASMIVPSAKSVMKMRATAALIGIETAVTNETNRVIGTVNETAKRIANALVATVLCRETKATLPDDIRAVPNVAIAKGTTSVKEKDLQKEARPRLKTHIR